MSMQSPKPAPISTLRNLIIVLGDQLDMEASALQGFDPALDGVWMAEVRQEATHVPSSKQRTVMFLSAMRHFAQDMRHKGWRVDYTQMDDPDNTGNLHGELLRSIATHKPKHLRMTAPGDWRVLRAIQQAAQTADLPLDLCSDTHFMTTVRDFTAHAAGRKSLRMEFWYRELRKKTGLLMTGAPNAKDSQPVGGEWNFDADNRESFGKAGPGLLPAPTRFSPDTITQSVMAMVQRCLPLSPGHLENFAWPVTRAQALVALNEFISYRLPLFGRFEDAMWAGEPWLYHSHLSAVLNLKLLNPREVLQAAEKAYHTGHAPLPAVEGFIRQILGWREYVRGIYWTHMPDYAEHNALNANAPLPAFFWTGDTDMACLRDALQQTLNEGYAHHIQRLMVLGLYTLLLGVDPKQVHEWFLSVYVDAVEWVELPNTVGMSQFGDGGMMASKPYVASGKYIQRMSNHCQGCRYDPAQSTGERACPYTTLYWDFLRRHQPMLSKNPRMAMQLKNLNRLNAEQQTVIQTTADAHRAKVSSAVYIKPYAA